MWLEIEKEEILSKFSILAEHGFIFEFLTFAKSDTIPMDTIVALVHNHTHFFAIKRYRKYPLEPICFYKLDSREELREIFVFNSSKEINVYGTDLEHWKRVMKKKSFLSSADVFTVVSESIKRQIASSRSFYGISIDT